MSFWNNIKNFTSSEFDSPDQVGSGILMEQEFIEMLDCARDYAQVAFYINSGYRTKEHNADVGGKITSSHLKACAADIHVGSSTARSIIINALVHAGLGRRIGIGSNFIHVDNDPEKTQSWWLYPPKTNSLSNPTGLSNKKQVKLPPFAESIQLIKSGSNTDWSHDFYDIEALHEKGIKGKGVKVAILDTGIDLSHNSFKTAIAEGRLTAVDAREGHNDPNDGNGHGTWCASRFISDGKDVLGFAPECTVISYKVLNDNGSGNLQNVIRAAEMAIKAGCDIISTSLGWAGEVDGFINVVNKSKERGILWLSAAGNDGTREDIDYPALYGDIISVGSHDKNRKRSRFSDYGLDLDLYSSGQKVLGAYTKNREAYLDGTSMATPSLGALITLMFDKLMKENGKIDRHVLRKISTCQ